VQEILKESFPQAATTFTDEEKEAYKLESSMVVANLNDQYQQDRRKFNLKETYYNRMKTHIQGTISRDNFSLTSNCESPHDVLVNLRIHFCPNNKIRQRELKREY